MILNTIAIACLIGLNVVRVIILFCKVSNEIMEMIYERALKDRFEEKVQFSVDFLIQNQKLAYQF